MRNPKEIKEEGKTLLFANYLPFVLVGLILAFVTGGLASSRPHRAASGGHTVTFYYGPFIIENPLKKLPPMAVAAIVAIIVIFVIAAIMIEIFVKNPFEYGCRSWFRHQAEGDKEAHVTDIFRSPDLKRVIETMFRRDLSVFLHFLLLIVPGVIKSFEYYFVPQLLEDHPELSPQEILDLSSEMMEGRKMELFKFVLSFFGWWLLGAFTFRLTSIFFSNPYQYISEHLYYLDLSDEKENW